MKVFKLNSTNEFFTVAFEREKSSRRTFTVQKFAEHLGIGLSSLKMILAGQRQPTVRQTIQAAQALHLSESETNYLDALACLENADADWERRYYSKKLKASRKAVRLETLVVSNKDVLADPISFPLLIYLIELGDDRARFVESGDFDMLARQLGVSPDRIRKLVSMFKQSQLLSTSADGQTHITFDRFKHKHDQKQYLKSLLTTSQKKIDTDFDSKAATFLAYTFSAGPENLESLKSDLKRLMEKYLTISAKESGTVQVAQAGFQIFPLATIPKPLMREEGIAE